jgi:hypothetical protein
LEASSSALVEVLTESRRLGLLGPGDVERHIAHAVAFGRALLDEGAAKPSSVGNGCSAVGEELVVADLGAGGGVPSLPMAVAFEQLRMVLIDASAKRTAFLVWAVVELGLAGRVEVERGRAEVLGHDERHRFAYDAVVARSFGPPATTLECAAPLLREGGRCVISEPPEGRTWPAAELAELGLSYETSPPGYAVFTRSGSVPDELPRPSRDQVARPILKSTG